MGRFWAQQSFFWRCKQRPRAQSLLCCSELLQCRRTWQQPNYSAAGVESCFAQASAGVPIQTSFPFHVTGMGVKSSSPD